MKLEIKRQFLDITSHNLLGAFTISVSAESKKILEETFKIYIKDKPRYMPKYLWNLLIRIIIKIEVKK